MSTPLALAMKDSDDEVAVLVQRLYETQTRLQALADGGLDAVVDASGHAYLLHDAQERLRRSEAAQQELAAVQSTILNALPAHIALLDQGGVIMSVNDGWRRFAETNGLQSASAGVGQNYLGVCDRASGPCAGDAAAAAAGIRSVLTGATGHFALDYPCHAPDQARWFRLTVRPLTAPGAVGAVVMHMDITEQTTVGESHARLALAVEHASEHIIITDTGATILYVNPAFERVTGYERAEALGRNPRLLKSGMQDAAFYSRMWGVLARGDVWRGNLINRRKDGQLFEEDATISPVRNAAGVVVNFVGVKRDVTREVQMEAQLRQSQKMDGIGQLAGGIAHDFNNILSVIMIEADMAGDGASSDEVRAALSSIKMAAERAANLTRQLLLFSRKQVMQPRVVDLNDVVTSLASMLKRIVREDVRLQLHLDPAPLWTHADAGMLDQVLLNLVVNAQDAMPTGGHLTIETAEQHIDADQAALTPEATPGRYAWLSVSDTGCGIAPDTLPHIFEPFFTTKGVGKGTGLGLATAFGIVKQHQGWLKVSSDVGSGTTFEVFLPASADRHDDPLASGKSPARRRGGSETILVVEDDAAVRALTCLILKRSGYQVLEAASGGAALEIWSAHRSQIALLVTDLVMPGGVDGRELAARIQRQRPALKVIITSGYSAEIAGRELKLESGQSFLQKPYASDQLVGAVRDRLDE